ncbi:putative quinol monooxygenase [Rhizobium sp. BK008]|uniref:putative quinol monooxygenase n=1 Tax=Rhizobium sp. BK008 TaxID=2587094 RepID=UPI001619748F|nr:antibiotic biosynthesis monooxygenase [Rhizobium sp. BK008]
MNQSSTPDDKTGKVRLSGQLICTSLDEVDIVQKYLPEHIRLTRSEPGCLSFDVRQTEDPMIWDVEERFTDRLAFEAHQIRTKGSAWGAATSAIRREYEISADS